MIRVFGQTDKTFASNGDIVLKPLKAKITKKDNSDYYLDLETDLSYTDYLVEGNIIVAPTPQGEQAFRVSNVTKNKSKLTTKCWHVFYDSKNYLVNPVNIVNKSCSEALNLVNSSCEPLTEFLTASDVSTINSLEIERTSLYGAIKSIVETWGGHLVRDNFNISILSEIGTDNGLTVQYKKNLKEITCVENWDSVVTKLLPVGKDGIMLNSINPSADIYIESETQYAIPYCKTVQFPQDNIDKDDYGSESTYRRALVNDLREVATAYVEKNCVPQINYTLKANLERPTDIGDTVEVIDERLGVNLVTSVIGYVYDVIAERYVEIEFGNFSQSLSNLVSNINSDTKTIVNETVTAKFDKVNDYIYARGTSDGWRFAEYASGAVELQKTVSLSSGTWTELITGLSTATFTITLPFNVTGIAVATVDAPATAWVASAKVTNNQLTLSVVSTDTTSTITANVLIKGVIQ